MSLVGALSIASGGLANITRQLNVISQNVANAGTPGYARELTQQQSLTADGIGMGVRSLPTTRATDEWLTGETLLQNATVAGLTTQQNALAAIDAVSGTPGQGNDITAQLGALQDGFSSLATSPDNPTAQRQVVSTAQTLATSLNTLSRAYATQRQNAQDAVVSDISTLNTTLSGIGALSDRIVKLRAIGSSSADLENQRDAAVTNLSQLINVKSLVQNNGDMILLTSSGLSLPTHNGQAPFAATGSVLAASVYYPGGGVPGVTLAGIDVTQQLKGGRIGANLQLRDNSFPTFQAELDEFSQNLASRFDAQGLRLFSDPSGGVPAGGGLPVQTGYVGFAGSIGVNPAVQANSALVRDGTAIVLGSAGGASAFTPNPVGGPAGFTTLITRVLDFALGSDAQAGVPQPASATAGLGPAGSLAAPYAAPTTLSGIAATLTAAQAQASGGVSNHLATERAVQTTLNGKLSSETGVSVDTEMSNMITLQSAYGANAKVISAAESMWSQLMASVT